MSSPRIYRPGDRAIHSDWGPGRIVSAPADPLDNRPADQRLYVLEDDARRVRRFVTGAKLSPESSSPAGEEARHA